MKLSNLISVKRTIIFCCIAFLFVILFGCTERDIVIPYTTGQFVSGTTDLNYTSFLNGDYNSKLILVDGNKLSVIDVSDLNVGGGATGDYLKLDTSNDPLTDDLEINGNLKVGSKVMSPLFDGVNVASSGSDALYTAFFNSNTGYTYNDGFSFGIDGDGKVEIYNAESTDMRFFIGGVEKMQLSDNGDFWVDVDTLYTDVSENSVGINTSSPSEALDVVGDIEVSADAHILSDNGTLFIGADDDVKHYFDGNDYHIENTFEDGDVYVGITDGVLSRDAIQIHGDEGSISFPRQSHSSAYRTTNFTIPSRTWTTIIYNAETSDILGEYDTSTGVFTAKDSGVYVVTVTMVMSSLSSNWDFYVSISMTGSQGCRQNWRLYNLTVYQQPFSLSCSNYVGAGGTIDVKAYNNYTVAKTMLASAYAYNTFTVTKVA